MPTSRLVAAKLEKPGGLEKQWGRKGARKKQETWVRECERGPSPASAPRPGEDESGVGLPGRMQREPESRSVLVVAGVCSVLLPCCVCWAEPWWCTPRAPTGSLWLCCQETGAEGQDVFIFSCSPRVELVAPGSRSPCGGIRGTEVSPRGAVGPPTQG